MSDERKDQLLDENLARLLRSADLAQPSDEQKARMLEPLKAKQAELYPAGELCPAKKKARTFAIRSPFRLRWLAAVAAVVLFAVLVYIYYGWRTLAVPALARHSLVNPVRSTPVVAGEVTRTVLQDGTVVIARGGTKYSADKPRSLELEAGEIYLLVAKGLEPFSVTTKDGEISAKGTRFVTSTGESTFVAVAQGQVTLSNPAGQVQLLSGQQGVLKQNERPTRQPAPRLSHLVSWAREVLAQEKPLVEKTEHETGELIALDPSGQEVRLTLRKYHVDVFIEDGIARTTIDQTYFNHVPWNTEGTFYFPLPPDASVSRLAMYVNGQLMEGGMVERSRGQEIYTEILYQRRDPALLEMMEGNVFKMRIFPLEGRQEKRIFLSYTQKLPELYGTLRYWFPMDHTQNRARDLSINVRVKDGAAAYSPQSSTHAFQQQADGRDLLLAYQAKDAKPDQDILFHLVPDKAAGRSAFATLERDGYVYFFGRITPDLPGQVTPQPRQWVVLNDVSASRSEVELRAQAYILERLIQEADDSDTLALVCLNTKAQVQGPGWVSVSDPAAMELAAKSGIETGLGGTNLAAGLESAAQLIESAKAQNPHILYLGDGVATDGQTETDSLLRKLPSGTAFVGIGVGKKADSRLLQAAADESGGMFVSVNPDEDIDWRVFDLLAALNTPRVVGLDVQLKSGAGDLGDVIAYPSVRTLAHGETLFVVGRGKHAPKTLTVRGKAGSEAFERTYSLEGAKTDAEFIPRFWAKQHIDELLKSGPEHKDEIVSLSRQYYVMTPYTSLIVLENEQMYKEFNVEQGRKDHWALYPAPKQIEVVKEPVDWSRWSWWGGARTEDDKVKAKADPKSVQEIVDSIQFRINAPFYYWRPQQYGQGRFALYQLLDSKADPTRLLVSAFQTALRRNRITGRGEAAAETGSASQAQDVRSPECMPPEQAPPPIFFELNRRFHNPFLVGGRLDAFLPPLRETQLVFHELDANGDDDVLTVGMGNGMVVPAVRRIWRKEPALPRVRPAFLQGDIAGGVPVQGIQGVLAPRFLGAFQQALGQRIARIDRDVRAFNRQHGGWRDDGWSYGWDQLDLRKSASARWYGGLEEAFGGKTSEGGESGESMTSGSLGIAGSINCLIPASALLPVYAQALKAAPGVCAALAVDYVLAARKALASKSPDAAEKEQLAAIEQILGGMEEVSTRFEDSGIFWSYQGWGYRPQPWTFEPPEVQAHPWYNWSFDLTRYADGLYSNGFDILNLLADEYGLPPGGKVSPDARDRIQAARDAIRPVRVRLDKDGPELLAGPGDTFAAIHRTEMYLKERVVCDGQNIYHFYPRLGLAARRKATDLRRAVFRQLTPHLVEPVEWLSRQYDVELAKSGADRFVLKLVPIVRPGQEEQARCLRSQETVPPPGERQETPKPGFHLLLTVSADGSIAERALVVGRKTQFRLTYTYQGTAIIARWFDKDGKQSGSFEYVAEPFEPEETTFRPDLGAYVVFDMPLRKPSYYQEHLKALENEQETESRQIDLKRHLALAHLQELNWRRWGGSNSEAYAALTQAVDLMTKAGHKAKLGDLTLLGSSGYNPEEFLAGKTDVPAKHPVRLYYQHRPSGWSNVSELVDRKQQTFIGHLAAYHAAVRTQDKTKEFELFRDLYPESPLMLAAAFYCSRWNRNQRPQAWLDLLDNPKWREMAILMAASSGDLEQGQQTVVAEAFDKLHAELSDKGLLFPVSPQIATLLQNVERGKYWKPVINRIFEGSKKADRIGPLLRFAELALLYGETALAEEALTSARKKLPGAESTPSTSSTSSTLFTLALAQTYWAGGNPKEAYRLYEEILKSLQDKKIAASPALLAAAARLAQQAGDHARAIEYEERALAAEQKYLPEIINLQAFRERYQWLWREYERQVQQAVSRKDDAAVDQWLSRAQETWLRWFRADRDDPGTAHQMATLQMTAGRKDNAWLYLSSIIDQKPRDAQSYYNVGQWYLGRNELSETERFYARAYECDTANPMWLWERGQVLEQANRADDAKRLYRQIVNGKWAPGLQWYADQAKKKL
jgi:tetratricopeptide (TPR) repeat protein